jgi:hypothetical protein
MIRQDSDIQIERSGKFEEASFGIDDSDVALILEIVRNKLYTNKMGSFVREIISNCYDAMKDAGTLETHSVQIILPEEENHHTVTIRDFGTGIEHDKVMTLYTRVGKSLRSNSNDFIGMMGIGRLVGFCLTDSFNVISFVNGVRTEYLCYIDETKRGKVAVLSRNETDEPNGLAVKVNIEPGIQSSFYTELVQFVRYADKLKFDIRGVHTHTWEHYKERAKPGEILYKGTGWTKYSTDPQNRKAYVRMGIVTYPLDVNYVSRRFFDGGAVVFDVPIGSVDVTASREGLEYTKKTIETVNNLTKTSIDELKKKFEEDAAKQPTLKDALTYYARNSYTYRLVYDAKQFIYTEPGSNKKYNLAALVGREYYTRQYSNVTDVKGVVQLDKEGNPRIREIEENLDYFEIQQFDLHHNGRREKGKARFRVDDFSGPVYYRMVTPENLLQLPDMKRCRTLNVGGTEATIFNVTDRSIKHFIKKYEFDPRVFWKDFSAVAETAAPRLPKGEREPVKVIRMTFDKSQNSNAYCVVESVEKDTDLDSVEPGIWVSRYYSQTLYRRNPQTCIEPTRLNVMLSYLAGLKKKKLYLYVVPANVGRLLDQEWEAGDKDMDDLVPAYHWIDEQLKDPKVLSAFTEYTTSLSIASWEDGKARDIYNQIGKLKPKTIQMGDVLQLFRKALKPALRGEMRVDSSMYDFVKTHHQKEIQQVQSATELLDALATDLNKKYPLFPKDLDSFHNIKDFMEEYDAYDTYLHAINSLSGDKNS